jgi:hypothetical protein
MDALADLPFGSMRRSIGKNCEIRDDKIRQAELRCVVKHKRHESWCALLLHFGFQHRLHITLCDAYIGRPPVSRTRHQRIMSPQKWLFRRVDQC